MELPISRWTNLKEISKSLTAARYGIDNTPSADHLANIRVLCMTIYDPVCNYFNTKIPYGSWYRSPALNKKIGGATNSQHMTGQAVDLDVDGMHLSNGRLTNKIVFDFIRKRLEFDQLIWEFGTDLNPEWVHVSYNAGRNRQQLLRAEKIKGKTVYTPILT